MRLCLMMIASGLLLWGCSPNPYTPRADADAGPDHDVSSTTNLGSAASPVTVKMGGFLQAGVSARP